MTTFTSPIPTTRSIAPTSVERFLLQASLRMEAFANQQMQRRATRVNPVTRHARAGADERRRTAQALGNLGILPR